MKMMMMTKIPYSSLFIYLGFAFGAVGPLLLVVLVAKLFTDGLLTLERGEKKLRIHCWELNVCFEAMNCGCLPVSIPWKGKKRDTDIQVEEIDLSNLRIFTYNSLRSATNNFHFSCRIGGGGFGVVHRGVLRDGTQVAIKSLSAESKQGSHEFLTEIKMISRIEHPNLVKLIGCCVEDCHRILVYEFLQNNSLFSILLGSRTKHVLDWAIRATICKGTASGLAFLHDEADPHVVHRDIKASNILLDENFNPKIGDFGLAKLFPDDVTHLSTRVAGTMGYLAPEYALLGQLTKKADVYSFGVLMLEIISGRNSSKAAFGDDLLLLVEWTWKLKKEERLLDIVDQELTVYPEGEVTRFIKVALFCTQASANLRPTMKQVVEMLSKEVHLNEQALTEPGVFKGRSYHDSGARDWPESSSSQAKRGKPSVTTFDTFVDSAESETEIFPR